jgi:hypothetical protein
LRGEVQGDASEEIEGGAGDHGEAPGAGERRPAGGEKGEAEEHEALEADVGEAPVVALALHGDAEEDEGGEGEGPVAAGGGCGGAGGAEEFASEGADGDGAEGKGEVQLINLKEPIAGGAPRVALSDEGAVERAEEMGDEGVAEVEEDFKELVAGAGVGGLNAGVGKKRAGGAIVREGPREPGREDGRADEGGGERGTPPCGVAAVGPAAGDPCGGEIGYLGGGKRDAP